MQSRKLWAALNDFNSSEVCAAGVRRNIFGKDTFTNKGHAPLTVANTCGGAILPRIEEEMQRASLVKTEAADMSSRLFLVMLMIAGSEELYKRRHQATA